jgi:hypothetical protein
LYFVQEGCGLYVPESGYLERYIFLNALSLVIVIAREKVRYHGIFSDFTHSSWFNQRRLNGA